MTARTKPAGRLIKAPESFLGSDFAGAVTAHGLDPERRSFLRRSFLAAAAASAAGELAARTRDGDPAILDPQPHALTLGLPVALMPYGQPSKYESNLQRRESPGLTRVGAASVSFSPLQGMFGIITANGLHFAARSGASMSRPTAGATGAARGSKRRCSASA